MSDLIDEEVLTRLKADAAELGLEETLRQFMIMNNDLDAFLIDRKFRIDFEIEHMLMLKRNKERGV